MSVYRRELATPLGAGGHLAPAGSAGAELSARVAGYKRTVASRYRAIAPDEVDRSFGHETLLVSPKVDGQFWCLVVAPDAEGRSEVVLVAPNGRVIGGDVPVLAEARTLLLESAGASGGGVVDGPTILAGELFALRRKGRPRVGDVGGALGGGADAETARLGFFAFDLLEGGDREARDLWSADEGFDYARRHAALERLLAGGRRVQAIKTERVEGPDGVRQLFAEWVEGGKGEGLVIRRLDERTYKLKPIFTLDAAVIGFTEQTDAADHVRSMLLALRREDGRFQLIGSVGNLGEDARRKALHEQLADTVVESSYRFASSTGALFRFVEPRLVVEVKVTDLQVEDGSGRPVRRMVLDFDDQSDDQRGGQGSWTPTEILPGVSLIHPILVRIRDDKEPHPVDVRLSQVLERVELLEVDRAVRRIERPRSEILRREVYAKTSKDRKTKEDKTAVRKLLVWRTHKDEVDDDYPPFVVHWTDYSPGRKDPLQREVRLAPDLDAAEAIAESMLAKGVKKGWARVDSAEADAAEAADAPAS